MHDAVPGDDIDSMLGRLRAAATAPPTDRARSAAAVQRADDAAHSEPQPTLDEVTAPNDASSPGPPPTGTVDAAGVAAYAARRGMQASRHGGYWCAPLDGYWSSYYAEHAREPGNTEPAPWVKRRRSSNGVRSSV